MHAKSDKKINKIKISTINPFTYGNKICFQNSDTIYNKDKLEIRSPIMLLIVTKFVTKR